MSPIQKGNNDLGDYVALMLDRAIYCDRAIMKTCYMLTDSYYIHVTSPSTEQYVVYFYSKADPSNKAESKELPVQQFLEELHDNQLRQILLTETQAIHEEIIRKAFSPAAELVSKGREVEDKFNIMISAV
ncbi:His-Xaa-Ser system protein HxsD [Buttiauxella sp.]|uniref:His-Xaa-Ser system protein HxsD n=1 Tax=Buttiauxella sp. TaxID=1972222 RepID=UPI003C7435D5